MTQPIETPSIDFTPAAFDAIRPATCFGVFRGSAA